MRILVQAHPAREQRAEQLARTLSARVIYDPDPDGPSNPWRTYRACLKAGASRGPTMIVQDDAVPHPDLVEHAERIHHAQPDRLVALYHGRYPAINTVRLARARGFGLSLCEMRAGRFIPSVCLIWPRLEITRAKAWIPKHEAPADDEMISRLFPRRVYKDTTPAYADRYLATIPSLVEHPDDTPSLMGTSRRAPRSAVFPPPGGAIDADWTLEPLAYI